MKKEVISVFEEETNRQSTSAEKIGKSIFWILTISLFLFLLIGLLWFLGSLVA